MKADADLRIDPDLVYTPAQIAARWNMSRETVNRLLRTKKLAGFQVGETWRVTGQAILDHEGRGRTNPLQITELAQLLAASHRHGGAA